MVSKCPFCEFKDRYRILYENNIVRAFLAKDALHPGQSLVAPIRHVMDFSELLPEETYFIFRLSSIIHSILVREFNYDGTNIILNNGNCAGQRVNHLHVHIVPRKCGDIPDPMHWLNDMLYKKLYQPTKKEFTDISGLLRKRIQEDLISISNFFYSQNIEHDVKIGENVTLGYNVHIYSNSVIGDNCIIGDNVIIGHPTTSQLRNKNSKGAIIGEGSIIRSGTVIYSNVKIGKNLDCGHNVLIRENTKIGNDVYILPGTQIHSSVIIGNNVRVYGFISNRSVIEDNASVLGFLLHAYREGKRGLIEKAPIVRNGAVVGMGAMVIGGVEIGKNSIVGAGAVVTKDVPPNKIVVGVPARVLRERGD
ncbi:MAG: HIT domain-containing protein [Thermoplasmata archaeon]|nr:HIT domain-containing protein [Thermoplasmata archaeon]